MQYAKYTVKDRYSEFKTYSKFFRRKRFYSNACGRLDKSTQKESALKMYREHLQREYEFNNWIEGFEELQRKNIKENIEYLKNKIAELEDC